MLNKFQLTEILEDWNYWNNTEIPKEKIGWVRQDFLTQIISSLPRKEIIALQGVRRGGKSTLMYQIMNYLIIEKHIENEQILYLNFEDFKLINDLKIDLLENFYNLYREKYNPKKYVYIFLDEIQNIPNWEKWLRTYFDRGDNVKFIISGSSSKLMSGELSTLLTGRNLTYTIYPFSFSEYLSSQEVKIKKEDDWFKFYLANKKNHALIKNYLDKYLHFGGFPEVAKEKNELIQKKLLNQYLTDIIYKDVSDRYKLREVKNIFDLAIYSFTNIGHSLGIKKLSRILEQSPKTISDLLFYLEKAYLLLTSHFFSFSFKNTINKRQPRKIYSLDNGFVKISSKSFTQNFGFLYENTVAQTLSRNGYDLLYWKNTEGKIEKTEVDFIIKHQGKILPINVTYDDNVKDREIDGIIDFCQKKGLTIKQGIIITNDLMNEEKINKIKIIFCPLWVFLLTGSFPKFT